MRRAMGLFGLGLLVAACSSGGGEPAVSPTSPTTTTTMSPTTTTVLTTTTTLPLTTTTTIGYNTEEDLQRLEEIFWEAFASCEPLITEAMQFFNPLIEDPEGARLIDQCKGPAQLSPGDMVFDPEQLKDLARDLTDLNRGLEAYVTIAGQVVRTGDPTLLSTLNRQIEDPDSMLRAFPGVERSGTWIGSIALAPLPKPPSFTLNVGFERGHEAVVTSNWFGSDNADVHFTDSRWCAGHRYPVVAEDGTEYGAGCTAELEAEADPTKTVRGDGWYYVGDEIAAGTWRSRGRLEDCYWAVYDIDGDIMDNHFGPSTTTMKISSRAYQVEIDGCGVWLYG